MAKCSLFLVLYLSLLGGSATPAFAAGDEKAQARQHYDRGSKLFRLGRFKEAVQEYEAAFELVDEPALLYNIAQAHRLDRNYERALFFYKSYLSRLPDAPNAADVQARIAELQKQVPAPAPPSPSPSPPQPALVPAPSPTPPSSPAPSPSTDRRRLGATEARAGIGLLAGGAAIVIGGVVLGYKAGAAANQVRQDAAANRPFDPKLEANGRAYDAAGVALDVIGGAAAVTGAVLVYLGMRELRHPRHAQLTPVGGPGRAGLVLGGTF